MNSHSIQDSSEYPHAAGSGFVVYPETSVAGLCDSWDGIVPENDSLGNNLLDNIDTQAVDLGRITASSVVLVSDDMPEALAISRALRQVGGYPSLFLVDSNSMSPLDLPYFCTLLSAYVKKGVGLVLSKKAIHVRNVGGGGIEPDSIPDAFVDSSNASGSYRICMWMDEVLTSDLTSYESQKQTSYYKFSRDPSWADRNSTETTPWIGTPQGNAQLIANYHSQTTETSVAVHEKSAVLHPIFQGQRTMEGGFVNYSTVPMQGGCTKQPTFTTKKVSNRKGKKHLRRERGFKARFRRFFGGR